MKTLLKADEAVEKKQKMVKNASQVRSTVDFENKRYNIHQGQSILVKDRASSANNRAVSDSRSQSKGRASSKWRQGSTRDSLEREA